MFSNDPIYSIPEVAPWKAEYAVRVGVGVEGTLSQGIRGFGLRRRRYLGLAKARLRHVAPAAAINVDRISAWFGGVPRTATRTSRFVRLVARSDATAAINTVS